MWFRRDRGVGPLFDAWHREGRMDVMARGHLATAGPVLDAIRVPERGRFLDVGCGIGYAGRRVAQRLPGTVTVAFDLAPGLLATVRRQGHVRHVFRADATRIPLKDATIDASFSMEVLYYVSRPEAALAEIRRVLRPGGSFDMLIDHYQENPHSAEWSRQMGVAMVRWTAPRWADAFDAAGFVRVTHRRVLPAMEGDTADKAKADSAFDDWARHHGTLHVRGEAA